MSMRFGHIWVHLFALASSACSSAESDGSRPKPSNETQSPGENTALGQNTATQGEASTVDTPAPVPPDPLSWEAEFEELPEPGQDLTDGGAAACASATAAGELQQLALAFAFDVSGSMGKGDEPYHDRALKWDPIVQASKTFFGSTDVARVSASLVFFPSEEDRCDLESYSQPNVALTPLPSSEFGDAIDDVTPESEGDWRGGTPTLAVVQATIAYVQSLREAGSTARHAIVLVTDGTPQGCSDEEDSVEAVAQVVASVQNEIPVYVIGVANPATEEEPEPPDNVSSLHQIAESGGTVSAILVDTGSPDQTASKFNEAIAAIRSQGLSCEIDIPQPPAGRTFDKESVNVSLTANDVESQLGYSPDCADAGAWRFDDANAPQKIVLCDDTCELTKSAASPSLQVEFGCERRSASVR